MNTKWGKERMGKKRGRRLWNSTTSDNHWNITTQRETSIRKNGLIQETEAKNCITQEHTFTKIILTASATQLIHREGQRNWKI